jgi:hypothetical protein
MAAACGAKRKAEKMRLKRRARVLRVSWDFTSVLPDEKPQPSGGSRFR